jgi:hypothetical protein
MSEEARNPSEGSEEAAVLALSGYAAQPVEAENNTESTSEPEDDTVADTEDQDAQADPDAEDEDAELIEVDDNDKRIFVIGGEKVTAKELKDGRLRQSDYSRKMNEVGEAKKSYDTSIERAEFIAGSLDEIAEAKAQAMVANSDVEFYEKTDWAELNATDARAYARTWQAYQTSLRTREQALLKAQNVEGDVNTARNAQHDEARAAMFTTLQQDLKGWGEELGTKITKYAVAHGLTQADLQKITNPRLVIALNKARQYDELQAAKAELRGKAQDAPQVARPGTSRRLGGKQAIQARFKQAPSMEDAIKLLN